MTPSPRGCEPPESYVYLILADRLSFGTGKFQIDEWLEKEPGNEILEVAYAYYVGSTQRFQHSGRATRRIAFTWEIGRK